ncbi:TPA: hypothetical protein RQK91_002674 [Vibrio vulnificus]|nr:hypothetical protein [Vibrio vulnificus]
MHGELLAVINNVLGFERGQLMKLGAFDYPLFVHQPLVELFKKQMLVDSPND